jgi:hypothetical protein
METSGFGSVLTAELFRNFSVPKHSMNKADGLDPWLSVGSNAIPSLQASCWTLGHLLMPGGQRSCFISFSGGRRFELDQPKDLRLG